ncbi:MAG: hypothetical protein AB1554_06895 [Chloroflexota bacterium]
MSNTSGNFLTAIIDFLLSLFGKKKPQTPAPSPTPVPVNDPNEPAQPVASRVLLVVYDPSMEDGQKLSQKLGWYRTDDLIAGFMDDILQNSHGMARYEIVQRYDVDEFPAKVDGFRYTPQSYMDVLRGAASPHMPQEVDYQAILTRFNVLSRVSNNEIDEVWVFAFPHAGFYESTMGGAGAFWCNAPPLRDTASCPRRFVLMGFSYERYIGEMLESFGHRAESILEKTFEKLQGDANLWQRFIRYEQSAPGKAACGNIHFAPNSVRDYDWNNPTMVKSECYDWLLNFPNFKGDVRNVTSAEWGKGEIRAHHQWWIKHLPHVAGRQNGIHNNWWQYVMDVNNVKV